MQEISTSHLLGLWASMEDSGVEGIVKRLYDSRMYAKISATLRLPARFYGIACSFKSDTKQGLRHLNAMKELKVSWVDDKSFDDSQLLLIELVNPDDRDIFASLCESLIFSVKQMNDEKQIARTVINQLERWRKLLSQTRKEGLSPDEQQGLFGELYFLEKLLELEAFAVPDEAVHTWVGMNAELRDFQGNGWAVEVKTTSGSNPQLIRINGERQLDETLLDHLYLFHLSVDKAAGTGRTLCQQVDAVRLQLKDNLPALQAFNDKLVTAGFLTPELYLETSYAVRKESLFVVKQDFPRIREKELRNGVGQVDYCIDAAICNHYLTSYDIFVNSINHDDRN